MSARLLAIFEEITRERERQERKARENHDIGWRSMADPTTPTVYRLAVLGEEVGEVSKALNEIWVGAEGFDAQSVREELIQVAAVAVAWIEGIDAGWTP